MNAKNSIGVFDSGLGGISVLRTLKQKMPNENFIYFGDSHYGPYGPKSKSEVINRCDSICNWFTAKNVKAIVIACNTATSASAIKLRAQFSLPIIGMEPALKMAAYNKQNQKIIVLATALTLKEEKFANLLSKYDVDNTIYKIPCPELVGIVENNQIQNMDIVEPQFNEYFKDIDMTTIDSMVLGCTHFVFFKQYLQNKYPNINIYDGNIGTANHLYEVLKENDLLNTQEENGIIQIYNSSSDPYYIELSNALLEGE